MGIVPSCIRSILSSVWFEGNEISLGPCSKFMRFKPFNGPTELLHEWVTWTRNQTRKSPIPVPPIPDLAGNRGGNPRFPIRPGTGVGVPIRRAGDLCNVEVPITRKKSASRLPDLGIPGKPLPASLHSSGQWLRTAWPLPVVLICGRGCLCCR